MNTKVIFRIILLFLIMYACSKKIFIESNLQDDAFVTVGNLSSGRFGHASVASDKDIFIIGGLHLSTRLLTTTIEIFNVENQSVKVFPTAITPTISPGTGCWTLDI